MMEKTGKTGKRTWICGELTICENWDINDGLNDGPHGI